MNFEVRCINTSFIESVAIIQLEAEVQISLKKPQRTLNRSDG